MLSSSHRCYRAPGLLEQEPGLPETEPGLLDVEPAYRRAALPPLDERATVQDVGDPL